MKIILILALARVVSRHNQFTFNKSFQSDLLLFFKIIGVSLVPSILILLQNDLGTTLVLAAIIAGVMLVSWYNMAYLSTYLYYRYCWCNDSHFRYSICTRIN